MATPKTQPGMYTGASALLEALHQAGVKYLFSNFGSDHPAVMEAIAQAVRQAGQDDIVLIAGKGHENYQVIGGQTLPFSDRQSALAALLARSTGSR